MSEPAYAAAAFLRAHVRDQVSLADVADAVGYSPFHLARLFTASVRMSPIRYLASQRFHLAKHLLLTESAGVIDVCHEVGFSSPGTFGRRFLHDVGIAPAELRRLADEIAEQGTAPFDRYPRAAVAGVVTGRTVLPGVAQVGPDPLVWIGFFPRPAPTGLPGAGVLRRGACEFAIPLVPGYPWLLATVVPGNADPLEHLAASAPFVAMHPAPLTVPAEVTLRFRAAQEWEAPILTALPALRKIGGA